MTWDPLCVCVRFQAETLFSDFIPLKITKLDSLLKVKHFNWQPLWPLTWENCSSLLSLCLSFIWLFCQDEVFSITETASLRAPLDIPIPDPPSPEDEVRAPQPVTLLASSSTEHDQHECVWDHSFHMNVLPSTKTVRRLLLWKTGSFGNPNWPIHLQKCLSGKDASTRRLEEVGIEPLTYWLVDCCQHSYEKFLISSLYYTDVEVNISGALHNHCDLKCTYNKTYYLTWAVPC